MKVYNYVIDLRSARESQVWLCLRACSAVLGLLAGDVTRRAAGAAPEYKYQSYAPPPLQLLAVCHPVERQLEQGQKNKENV